MNHLSYINEFAIESAKTFSWCSRNLIGSAFDATVALVVESNASNDEKNKAIKLLTDNSSFVIFFSHKTSAYIFEKKLERVILSEAKIIDNLSLIITINKVWMEVRPRIFELHGADKYNVLHALLTENKELFGAFIYYLVKFTRESNLSEPLISELYLQQEIELFRNRKDDNHDKTSESGPS